MRDVLTRIYPLVFRPHSSRERRNRQEDPSADSSFPDRYTEDSCRYVTPCWPTLRRHSLLITATALISSRYDTVTDRSVVLRRRRQPAIACVSRDRPSNACLFRSTNECCVHSADILSGDDDVQFLDQVEREYDNFDRLSLLVTDIETDQLSMFTSSDVYDAVGAAHDDPVSARSSSSSIQRKQVVDVLNSIVEDRSSLITYDQLFALHRTLISESSGQSGVLRLSAAVGYASPRIYRVFLPAGEVDEALHRLVDTINDSSRWHQRPLLCAYYAFAVLVFFIHPFHDGNGRCARLLGNLIAKKLGYPALLRASDKTIQVPEFLQRAVVTVEIARTNRRQTRQARMLSSRKETSSMWF